VTKRRAIHNIPKKTCPICGEKVNKRIQKFYCRHCGARLYSYQVGYKNNKYTIWVTDEPRMKDLALQVRDHVRELPDMEDFEYTEPIPQYGAAHVLLDICEGNQELAGQVITAFFDMEIRHENGIYGKVPRSMMGLIALYRRDQLSVLLAWAKKKISYRRKDVKREQPSQVSM